jgi:hypothetical protein
LFRDGGYLIPGPILSVHPLRGEKRYQQPSKPQRAPLF